MLVTFSQSLPGIAAFIVGLHIPTPPYRQWLTNAVELYRLSKGFGKPVAFTLIQLQPLVMTDITAVTKLTQDYKADDKAGAEADVAAVIPTLALISGKTVDEVSSVLPPELAGTLFDVSEAAPSFIKALELALAAKAATA